MVEEIQEKLEAEIEAEIESLSLCTSGSDEQTAAVDNVTKLYQLRNESDRLTLEKARLEETTKGRHWEVIRFAVGSGIYVGLAIIGYNVEKTGRLTSDIFRELRGHNPFKPKT